MLFLSSEATYATGSGKTLKNTVLSGAISNTGTGEEKEVSSSTGEDIDVSTSFSGNTQTGKTTEEVVEETQLKQDINESIIEFIVIPKAKQIIKDLSIKLTKQFPDPIDRIEAYKSIINALQLRKNKIETMKMSNSGKYILKEFSSHMIELLDKKISELKN